MPSLRREGLMNSKGTAKAGGVVSSEPQPFSPFREPAPKSHLVAEEDLECSGSVYPGRVRLLNG
jgi:hypothetical protein